MDHKTRLMIDCRPSDRKHRFLAFYRRLRIIIIIIINSVFFERRHELIILMVQGQNLIHAKLPTLSSGKRGSSESPVHAFVTLERYNAIKAVQFVHLSLAALSKVLRGNQLLTSDVQTVGSALINLEVSH